jgi:hypothetical protein
MVMMNYDEFRNKEDELGKKQNNLNKDLQLVKLDRLKNKKEKLVKKKQEVDKEILNNIKT